MPAAEGTPAEGIVKWFNSVKGFGFVAIDNNPQDAFLHISVVTRAGLQGLSENTRISCMVAPSQRGMQVTRIVEVLGVDPNAQPGSSSGGRSERSGGFGSDRGGFGGDRGFGGGGFGGGGFDRSEPSGPAVEAEGTVKWYKADKGFGFAVPNDGGKDVFIHRSVLGKVGLGTIEPGRKIRMQIVNSNKGREASSIEIVD